MTENALIRNTEKFVKEKLSGEGTGHDWWHVGSRGKCRP